MVFRKKRKLNKVGIDFDEILMDSHNIHAFDTQQFEGRIEQSISKRTFLFIGIFFFVVLSVFVFKLQTLQIKRGEAFFELSQKNSLDSKTIFADRGVIFDRNEVELAWNERTEDMQIFDYSKRAYTSSPGHNILLGYIQYPQKDKAGFYWKEYFEGLDGIEKSHNDYLNGINGSKIVEVDVMGDVYSENIVNEPVHGRNLKLTIDSRLQTQMFNSIKSLSEEIGYVGGAGLVMDITTGELLVATSFPEYDSKILSDGENREIINSFIRDPNKPFLNRAVGGLYSPGSTVKPFIALGALNEKIIDGNTVIYSSGEVKVPNPYNKEQFTIFRDWKEGGHGYTDVTKAIAESVNTFFYAIGGGYENQTGLGISRIEKYVKMFDIGEKTGIDILGEVSGVVPNPEWKKRVFKEDTWRLGDTYNTSIGQYGFQVTPVQMLRAVSSIANNGSLVTPHVVMENQLKVTPLEEDFLPNDYALIKQGIREVVTQGTGQILNVSYVNIAAKTGSAQTGYRNKFINSWVIGFFPYENPKYAFVILMEKGPSEGERSASFAARTFFDWVRDNAPEYLEKPELLEKEG